MQKLKYLFIAEYADGTIFKQTPEDKSQIDSKRNCYFDVLQSGKTIRRFSIKNDKNMVTVDLGNGIFYINGLPVILESERLPCLPSKFELIWYHQVTRDQKVIFEKKTGKILKTENLPEFREYFIGWQCLINGRNYQVKLGVA